MAVRPNDYGDQFPSDQGDVPPNNPVSNYSENDYQISKVDSPEGSRVRPDQLLYPDQRVSDAANPPRTTFTGILLRKQTVEGVHPSVWTCLRQDGKYGTAQLYGDEGGVYQEYRAGDQVTLHRGQQDNTWWITGAPRNTRQPIMEVKLSTGFTFNTNKIFPFDTKVTDFATNGAMELGPTGGIVVQGGMYDITFQVTAGHMITDSAPSTLMVASTHTKTTNGDEQITAKGGKALFSTYNGFFINKYDNDCNVYIGIRGMGISAISPTPDKLLYQPPGSAVAYWTNNPKVGGSFTIGTKTGQSWLKLGSNTGNFGQVNGIMWFGNGSAHIKYRFPDQADMMKHDTLAIGAASGDCAQLYHQGYGGTGLIWFGSGFDAYALNFSQGQLISGGAGGVEIVDGVYKTVSYFPICCDLNNRSRIILGPGLTRNVTASCNGTSGVGENF